MTAIALGPVARALIPRWAPWTDTAATDAAVALLDAMPAVWWQACLEARLAPGDSQLDVSVCASADAGRLGLGDALDRGTPIPHAAAWRPLIEAWLRDEPALRWLTNLWLEYDLPGAVCQDPFVVLNLQSDEVDAPRPTSDDVCALVEHVAATRPDRDAEAARLGTLRRCLDALPPPAPADVSILPAWRETRDLRLLAYDLSLDGATTWLDAVGWPGDRDAWHQVAEWLGDAWSGVMLNADLGSTVGPCLGVKVLWSDGSQAAREALVDRLVERGLCAASKAPALLAWHGSDREALPDGGLGAWPVTVDRFTSLKIDIAADGDLSAKSYHYFRPRYSLG